MGSYVGLDVSDKETAICVIDEAGEKRWEGKVTTTPGLLVKRLREHAPDACKIGLETGPLCVWLWHELNEAGFPVVALHARHAAAALSLQTNKNDKNDAAGLARLVCSGWYRAVVVKSMQVHRLRTLLATRDHLVGVSTGLINRIRGTLKTFGVVLGQGRGGTFERKVRSALPADPMVAKLIESMLALWQTIQRQKRDIDNELARVVRQDSVLRLLTTVPGVGPVTAISFATAVGDPTRFRRSRDVAAYLGLTPKQYQSGEVNISGRISKCGDRLTRKLLFEAATVVLLRSRAPTALKEWGLEIAARSGTWKARVAIARKLATVLHRMWISNQTFQAYPSAA